MKVQKPKHANLIIQVSGLVINPPWPFIGASPDDFLSCTCCGGGTLEIKVNVPNATEGRMKLLLLPKTKSFAFNPVQMDHFILIVVTPTTIRCKCSCS